MRVSQDPSGYKAESVIRRNQRQSPEEPRPTRGPAKKDTVRWCKGKEGVEHVFEASEKYPWPDFNLRWNPRKCVNCGREKHEWREGVDRLLALGKALKASANELADFVKRTIQTAAQHPDCAQFIHLKSLPVGWAGGNTEPPNDIAIINAVAISKELATAALKADKAIPSVEGGIGFVFTSGSRYADIECLNDGAIVAVYYTFGEALHKPSLK